MKKVRLTISLDIQIENNVLHSYSPQIEKAFFIFPVGHICEVLSEIENNKCVVKVEKIYHTSGSEVVLVSFNKTLKLGEDCEFI